MGIPNGEKPKSFEDLEAQEANAAEVVEEQDTEEQTTEE